MMAATGRRYVRGIPPGFDEGSPASWGDRIRSARDRWVANPRFQRLAAAFPLTRPLARRRARALFDLCAGFVYSQVLVACVRLGLFDLLAERPQTAAALANRLSLSTDAMTTLLDAAESLGLLSRRPGGRFALGPLGAPMVGNAAIAALVEHHALLYADIADPVALLRGDGGRSQLAAFWAYAGAENPASATAERVDSYTTLMAASQSLVADVILDAYSLRRHRCLLDVGGGDGSFLVAAAARATDLALQLFDLPPVAARARARFAAAGLAPRSTTFGGNFLVERLPRGADVASLVRVVHDHDDTAALTLLKAVRECLPRQGTLLLAEPMADAAGARPVGAAYFGFYLKAMRSGRPRTAADLAGLLGKAGFGQVRQVSTRLPLATCLLVATV